MQHGARSRNQLGGAVQHFEFLAVDIDLDERGPLKPEFVHRDDPGTESLADEAE